MRVHGNGIGKAEDRPAAGRKKPGFNKDETRKHEGAKAIPSLGIGYSVFDIRFDRHDKHLPTGRVSNIARETKIA